MENRIPDTINNPNCVLCEEVTTLPITRFHQRSAEH